MNTGDWAFLFVVLLAALCALACGIAWKVAYADGHEAGRLYERNRQNRRRLVTQARVAPPAASPAGGHPPWATTLSRADTRVLFELPGGYRPALSDYVATTRFPRLIATTAELKAMTDMYIEGMRRDGEDYRKALTQ